tara:strand:- start:2176 stop:2568 length:393 start_codon:yes stop_codon:yes gene_type:complete
LLKTKLNIQSHADVIKQRRDFAESNDDKNLSEIDDWSQVKRKEVKNILLERFALDEAKKHNWNRTQTRKFLFGVLLAFQLKALNAEHVILKHGKITEIIGVDKISSLSPSQWDYTYRSKPDAPTPRRLIP